MEDEKEFSAFEFARLITRKTNGTITAAEEQTLESWKLKSENNSQLFIALTNELSKEQDVQQMLSFDSEASFNRLKERLETPVISMRKRHLKTKTIISIAAALILSFSVSLYIYSNKTPIATTPKIVKYDVAPGGNKAILTLGNGKVIILNNAGNGTIAQQSGIQILKTAKGQLTYQITARNSNKGPVQYNTITTPNGGQYQVILPDGTKVWLNAASSLRYPTRFEGNERLVTLNGEAYFEVFKNKHLPFIVSSENQQVKVLGTHFNIKSYNGEPIITTLLEGSVKIKSTTEGNAKEYLLKPGQQATHQNGQISIQAADIEANTAWKDGQFIFHNTGLRTIMLEMERWYDVKVDFSVLPDDRFNGAMSRDVKLSQVLQMLELTSNLKFTIQGRRIMLQK